MTDPSCASRTIPENERRAVAAACFQLVIRSAVLREQAARLTALRQRLPLPAPHLVSLILESQSGAAMYPAVELATDIECSEEACHGTAQNRP